MTEESTKWTIAELLERVESVDEFEDRLDAVEAKVRDLTEAEEQREEPMDEHDLRSTIRDEISDKVSEIEDLAERVDDKLKELDAFDGEAAVTQAKLNEALTVVRNEIMNYVNDVAQQITSRIDSMTVTSDRTLQVNELKAFPFNEYQMLDWDQQNLVDVMVHQLFKSIKKS